MRGMINTDSLLCVGTGGGMPIFHDDRPPDPTGLGAMTWGKTNPLPDLSDPATLGCLLALVREAWGKECCVSLHAAGVTVTPNLGFGGLVRHFRETSNGRNLVAALEAAP